MNNERTHLIALPPALEKACGDPFDYALGLRDGTIIRFHEATYEGGEWIHLSFMNSVSEMIGADYSFDRGIDVRISDISWVADAPNGS